MQGDAKSIQFSGGAVIPSTGSGLDGADGRFTNHPHSCGKKIKNTYHHIGCYIYKVSILKKIASLKQTNNEKKLKLEQYRWIDNLIPISLVLAKKKPIGVDTAKDFKLVKKIMENKF